MLLGCPSRVKKPRGTNISHLLWKGHLQSRPEQQLCLSRNFTTVSHGFGQVKGRRQYSLDGLLGDYRGSAEIEHSLRVIGTREGRENLHKESVYCGSPLLTRPGGVQPVLDVQDLLIFGSGECFLTDLIVLGDFLLEE